MTTEWCNTLWNSAPTRWRHIWQQCIVGSKCGQIFQNGCLLLFLYMLWIIVELYPRTVLRSTCFFRNYLHSSWMFVCISIAWCCAPILFLESGRNAITKSLHPSDCPSESFHKCPRILYTLLLLPPKTRISFSRLLTHKICYHNSKAGIVWTLTRRWFNGY